MTMRRGRLTQAGGALAVVGGIGHLAASSMMRRDVWAQRWEGGLADTVSLTPTQDQLEVAEAYWFSVGSFGAPLLALGGLVTWLARRGVRVPGPVGWGIASWAALLGVLGSFDVGTWLLALIGVLIGAGDLPVRAGRPVSATSTP